MKFVPRLFIGIGGFAAAAALLTMVSPKAHALVATLVQVENTRSTPVPNQDVDAPGRHPYQQQCFSNIVSAGDTSCSMPSIPANTQVVIQTVSMVLSQNVVPQFGRILTSGGGVGVNLYIPFVAQSGFFIAAQPLTVYADSGSGPTCDAATNSAAPNSSFLCVLTGYSISLP